MAILLDGDMMEAEEQPQLDDSDSLVYTITRDDEEKEESVEELKPAPQLQMSYNEFWEDLLDQACPAQPSSHPWGTVAGTLSRKMQTQRIQDEALDTVVENMCVKSEKRGFIGKAAVNVWNYGKQIATPAIIGAVLGYFSAGIEGAQQGAIAGSIVSLPVIGINEVAKYVKKDSTARNGREYKAIVKEVIKSGFGNLESPKELFFQFIGGTGLYTGVYALTGAFLSQGAGLCAQIGLIQGMVSTFQNLVMSKKVQNSVRKEIREHPTKYFPGYVPPTKE